MIKQLTVVFSLILSLTACENKNTNNKILKKEIGLVTTTIDTPKSAKKQVSALDTAKHKRALSIDTFSVFPPEINGCACYSSNNLKEFKANKFIYADDYGDKAFVSINGKMTKFKLQKVNTISDKHTISVGISEDKQYELIIDSIETGEIDETTQDKGVLTLKSKDGTKVVKNIVGECGC
jgi:hypothetical protein